MFTSASPNSDANKLCTASTAEPVLTGDPDRRLVLLGHVIVTKSRSLAVKDEDMAVPEKWQEQPDIDTSVGHKEDGRTIAVHSLAIVPEYQKLGLGQMLMKSYIQRTKASDVADRLALITHEGLVAFYEKLGFQNRGKTDVKGGGGEWVNMICSLQDWHDS